jgi:RNA polymerase sigma factor (sigma-70 family)
VKSQSKDLRVVSDENASTRQSLLLRVRDLTDRGAWQDFVECYAPRVFSWCRRFGLQEADAADATQMVLLKLVEGLRSFDYDSHKGRFRGWLKTVTRHVVVDVLRSWRERATGDSQVQMSLEEIAEPDAASSLFDELELAYQQELVRRAGLSVQLRVLPKTWDAYRMACEDQIPAADVAISLCMPVSEVYVAKSRVLKMLRTEVARLDEDRGGHE